MRIVASTPPSSTHARLVTDYLSTDGHCIELYYMINGKSMVQVKIRGEDFIERQLGSSTIEVIIIMYTDDNLCPNVKHAELYDQETHRMCTADHKTPDVITDVNFITWHMV